MPTVLERIGAVAGTFNGTALTFTDAPTEALVETGDVLIAIVYGATSSSPAGGGWAPASSAGNWKAWIKTATAGEAFPTAAAADAGDDAAGVLLVYRHARPSYVIGDHQARTTSAATSHATPAATVIDGFGLLLGLWLGSGGGPELDPGLATPILEQETSNASGGGERWFKVVEAAIATVPNAGTLTMTTPGADNVHAAIVALRDRPPILPAVLVDSGAGANLGLLP